jgi:hypothetical protein
MWQLPNTASECSSLFVFVLVSALAGPDEGHQEAGEK